jgi:phosphoribosyl-AMP cyclohydrolase
MLTAKHPSSTLPKAFGDTLSFDAQGLIPAIVRSADDGEVLMLAWMNGEALADTLTSGYLCYWSRSRGKLWRKGEISGQRQRLIRGQRTQGRRPCSERPEDALWTLK